MRTVWPVVIAACLLCVCPTEVAWPQGPAANADATARPVLLSGLVTDPSGARVAAAAIHVARTDGTFTRDLSSDASGKFALTVPAGLYDIVITSAGFDPFFKELRIASIATTATVDARLIIATGDTVVQVNADSNQLSTSEADNKSQLSFSGDQLKTFSDDDATFQQQLIALSGGDGSKPPQIYVDGFSGGAFPAKSSIREIKINQNPFSAEYDQLGFGRVEISTKPGTGRLHGTLDIFGNPSQFNSQNPFLHQVEPGYYRVHTKANVSGPLDKKSSFFLSVDYYDQQNNAIVNTTTVNAAGVQVPLNSAVPDPQGTGDYTFRYDRQWSTNNTFTGRYELNRVALTNGGLSAQLSPSTAYNSTVSTQTLQLGNTQVVNPHIELESKFEWVHTRTAQTPVSSDQTFLVSGTLTDGGSTLGSIHDNLDHYEFIEKGSLDHGNHFIRAGMRYRLYREANNSNAGFNGIYTFTDLDQLSAFRQGNTASYSQFSVTTGRTAFSVNTQDVALYAEDEWKLRKSLTVDLGGRFEWQTAVPNPFTPSPHLGLAWAIHQTDKKPAPVVLRFGAATFYDRFGVSNLLTTVRQGDPNAQRTTITTPTTSSAAGTTTYRLAPDFKNEYDLYIGGGAEFKLGKYGTVSANIIQDRAVHQWYSRNANAPRADGTRPYGAAAGNIYEFASGGQENATIFFINPQLNLTEHLHAWAFLNIKRDYSDIANPTTFTSNSYNVHADYGRGPYDRRAQLFTGLDADLPRGFSIGYFLVVRDGQPFNITTGTDLNGDTIYNDRPSFATAASDPANVVKTPWGTFNTVPVAGEKIIPFDIGRGGSFFSLQLQASKTWRFGPRVPDDPDAKPEPTKDGKPAKLPDPRYGITFSVETQNLTNTLSPQVPIGALNSPNFGKSIGTSNSFLSTTAANRSITLHTSFSF